MSETTQILDRLQRQIDDFTYRLREIALFIQFPLEEEVKPALDRFDALYEYQEKMESLADDLLMSLVTVNEEWESAHESWLDFYQPNWRSALAEKERAANLLTARYGTEDPTNIQNYWIEGSQNGNNDMALNATNTTSQTATPALHNGVSATKADTKTNDPSGKPTGH